MPNKSQTKQSIARTQGGTRMPENRSQATRGGRNEWGAPESGKRDPSQRVTSKPDTKMEHATETAILRTCADVCNETLAYCLEQGHVEPDHILCLVDCIELCTLTAHFVARDSHLASQVLELCAQACKDCEESCEEYQDGDERMKACADVCREAYEHCVA